MTIISNLYYTIKQRMFHVLLNYNIAIFSNDSIIDVLSKTELHRLIFLCCPQRTGNSTNISE